WDRGGATSFSGDVDIQKAVRFKVNMLKNPEALVVSHLLIQDDVSNASFSARLEDRVLAFTFSGTLEEATLHRAFSGYNPLGGRARGDFEAQILLDNLVKSKAVGRLEVNDFTLPWQVDQPLKIKTISVTAVDKNLRVESARVAWGEKDFGLRGDVKFLPDQLWIDLDLETDDLDGEKLKALFSGPGGGKDAGEGKPEWTLPLRGSLKIKTGAFKYGRFTWRPLHVNLSFHSDGLDATVTDANLCGLSTPGVVHLSPQGLTLDFQPVSEGQELEPAVTCLLDKQFRGTGRYDLTGNISAEGKPEALPGSLQGHLSFEAREGRIYHGGLLVKLLSILSVTEIFRGKIPDIGKEGFGYYTAEVKVDLQNGRIRLNKAVLDGATVDIFCEGEIDILSNTVDLTVLATTFRSARTIVSSIPLVRDIFKEPLLAVPVRITGPLADPRVTPLSPLAVGTQLLGFAKGLLRAPIEVIRGVLPEEKEVEP
ncbi:MAG: AsmA-like C-terminal domain-containing protein, partial [Desulfobacterales bacterium]|nr:AsmA-like C-terminal domain-containing protein [Desulfobacterales bacterium]